MTGPARLRAIGERIAATSRQRGAPAVLETCARWGWQFAMGRLRPSRDPGRFAWEGREVAYFSHPYHYTWLNERAVEIALALEVLEGVDPSKVLEIGNVTGHYRPASHVVVDKYERAPRVVNTDVVDLDLGARFDLVLAISTLEHVGLDEEVVDPGKPRRAIDVLRGHLAPGGRLWVTHPVGYNPAMDAALRLDGLGLTHLRALRRERARNRWREVPLAEVWDAPYDRLVYTAHGIVVGEYAAPK